MARMQRVVGASRIVLGVRRRLKSYGNGAGERAKMKVVIAISMFSASLNYTAYDKAGRTVSGFLEGMLSTIRLKKKALKFNERIRRIQEKWRRNLQRDKIRIGILRKKWAEAADAMMKQEKKGKKHQALLRKLRGIAAGSRESALKSYFLEQKKEYLAKLAVWQKHGAEVNIP